MIKSYDDLFDNPYNPKLGVIHFLPIIETEPEIQPEFAENLQKQAEKKEEKPTELKTESTSLEPVYTLKDITPKKSLFRRK